MKNPIKGCGLAAIMLSATVAAEDSYSPYVGNSYPRNVYFGDTHLHTNLSLDSNLWSYGAKLIGYNNKLGPDVAYRFACGETVTSHNGLEARLKRPLDFLVVADHAENLGVIASLAEKDKVLLGTDSGKILFKKWQKFRRNSQISYSDVLAYTSVLVANPVQDKGYRQSVWQSVVAAAETYNQPGQFTALTGYEWTSSGGVTGSNLHRVVIFKDGPDKTNQVLPFSALDGNDPENLWSYLIAYQEKTGGEVIAIPHNGNLSMGYMFAPVTLQGEKLTREYAQVRSRFEPLFEVTQTKGTSETHPVLSQQDSFADYEIKQGWTRETMLAPADKQQEQFSYARSALKLGLAHQVRLGVNPFKFGMIGSTDSHTALAAAAENNFWIKEPRPDRAIAADAPYNVETPAGLRSASGYAAVWAEENTRESLFEAMKRRETYATTGPRMTVRFFGGWNYGKEDAFRPDLAKTGYAGGVPMGGDLTAASTGKAPSFLIRAVKDADGANLDRAQVIKGWRSADGELHEKIYNVALSDGRRDKGNKTKKLAAQSMWQTQVTPTLLVLRNSPRYGLTLISRPTNWPSIMFAFSKSPPRAGQPMTSNTSA